MHRLFVKRLFSRAFSVLIENQNWALDSCFDAFSLREPVPTPDQVRGRLSLENALVLVRPISRNDLGGALVEQFQADCAAEFAGPLRRGRS